MPAAAVGCPRFKLRPNPTRPDVLLRELHYAIGSIAPLSNARTGRYEFAVDVMPSPDLEPKHSPWEGMSGAAVWGSGRLIGVVGQHYPREGLGTLTVRPIDQLFGCASGAEVEAWREVLPQLPLSPRRTCGWRLHRPSEGSRWQGTNGLLGGAGSAGADRPERRVGRWLEAFTRPRPQWRWIQGDATRRQTAPAGLVWSTPPWTRVRCASLVSCGRTTGRLTADYALDVLTRGSRCWPTGEATCRPRFCLKPAKQPRRPAGRYRRRRLAGAGRRLLVLIDGLDEYRAHDLRLGCLAARREHTARQGRMLGPLAVPEPTSAFPPHPLRGAGAAHHRLRGCHRGPHAARADSSEPLRLPDESIVPLVCCLAIADSGLTS